MESYNKALRDKKELQKKLNMYDKEHRTAVSSIDMERAHIQGGLLDIQSKTRNLTDAVNAIATKLKEEHKTKQAEIKIVRQTISHPQTGRRGNREAILAQLAKQESKLLAEIRVCNTKLELLTGQKQQPEINRATNVVSLLGKKKGFGALLSNIRKAKQEQLKLPVVHSQPTKPDFHSPRNVCELITEFHKLPKIYPTKPKKKKPEMSKVLLEEYEVRRKSQELAMNYGTRSRIKRVEFHCNSLTGLYLTKQRVQRTISLVNVTQHAKPPGYRAGTASH